MGMLLRCCRSPPLSHSLSFNQSYKIARPVGELKFMWLLYMISMHMSSAFRSFNQAQRIEEAGWSPFICYGWVAFAWPALKLAWTLVPPGIWAFLEVLNTNTHTHTLYIKSSWTQFLHCSDVTAASLLRPNRVFFGAKLWWTMVAQGPSS